MTQRKQTHIIVGVHVTNRMAHVPPLQKILSEFGCNIRTRLGLHDAGEGQACSPNGLILLELVGERARCDELIKRLSGLEGIETQSMVFDHP